MRARPLLFFLLLLTTQVPVATSRQQQYQNQYEDPHELSFHKKVDAALTRVKDLLESTKSPRRIHSPSDVDHQYNDKYSLVEYVTNIAIAATTTALDGLGLSTDALLQLSQEDSDGHQGEGGGDAMKLRFESDETCDFVDKKTVEIVESSAGAASNTRQETYETTADGETRKTTMTTTKAVREVTEYHWRYTLSYKLIAFAGSNPSGARSNVIQSQTGNETIIVTGSERAPCQTQYTHPTQEVNLKWLLQQLQTRTEDVKGGGNVGPGFQSRFKVDRDAPSCKTPRRNDDVQEAVEQFDKLRQWSWNIANYLQSSVVRRIMPSTQYRVPNDDSSNGRGRSIADMLRSIDDSGIFVPVIPLFVQNNEQSSDGSSTTTSLEQQQQEEILPSRRDSEVLLREQQRTIGDSIYKLEEMVEKMNDLGDSGGNTGIASMPLVQLILLAKHLSSISNSFNRGVNHVEEMLRTQLITAIGKEINSNDFGEFTRSYYPKLFKQEYTPEAFIYAVRQPGHYPAGTISIEASAVGMDENYQPISTFTRNVENAAPMHMPINPATKINLAGEQYLHAWMRHEFGRYDTVRAQLAVRARQFSSFLLVVGNIAGPDTFDPKHAIIVSNKDEILIPLLLEQLPTPKEFKDAIQSLSPEQQDFARAFRTMQLESSVFAIAIIQLKPQLEDVLDIPANSLTKEIKLTQDLLELFIDYQVPSDLLSYDEDEAASTVDKLMRVKAHVTAVQEMITDAKERELKEATMKSDMKAGGRKYSRMSESGMNDNYMMADEMEPQVMMMASMDAMPEMVQARSAPKMDGAKMDGGATRRLHTMRATSSSATPSSTQSDHNLRSNKKEEMQEGVTIHFDEEGNTNNLVGNSIDFSSIAKKLDAAFDELDTDAALRPTKITINDAMDWKKSHKKTLLTPQETTYISQDDRKLEKNKAFDLLDALSKSGALPIRYSELHVIVAATHRFDSSLIETVCHSNENPVTSIERSALIVSSTINDLPVRNMLAGQGHIALVKDHSPDLLDVGRKETEQQ